MAIANQQKATQDSKVCRFRGIPESPNTKSPAQGLSFFNPHERVAIIEALDCLCQNMKNFFELNPVRRKSYSSGTKK